MNTYKCKFDRVKEAAGTARSPVRSVKETDGRITIIVQDEDGRSDYAIIIAPSTKTYGLGTM